MRIFKTKADRGKRYYSNRPRDLWLRVKKENVYSATRLGETSLDAVKECYLHYKHVDVPKGGLIAVDNLVRQDPSSS